LQAGEGGPSSEGYELRLASQLTCLPGRRLM
jgi:hypothetical protein